MFGAQKPSNVVFTLNCTQALNMVIKGILKPGDHVVTSCVEHNAVMRPLNKLEDMGITYTAATVFPGDDEKTLDSFRKGINAKTALIICTHASNVWGIRLPVERIAALGKIYGIPILIDGAQSAGILPIDVQKMGIDFLCVAGHKGLYGPMGTGMLITNQSDKLDTIIEGGTGTNSMKLCQPNEMPQKFESGTPNMPGICGLRAGMEFVKFKGREEIFSHENKLITYLYDNLKKIAGVKLYMPRPEKDFFVPLLSFNVDGYVSDEVGKILDQNGIEVRTGLHCSPAAHEFGGTSEIGVVRVSPSVFNTKAEVDKLVETIRMKIIG
jgi:selenocysteine lyase/cysteine desulfurase